MKNAPSNIETAAAASVLQPRKVVVNSIDGTRNIAERELQANSIPSSCRKFHREQISNSGYHEQLKYLVEPSLEVLHGAALMQAASTTIR
ncbi:hypothetical protein [Bradyrhizobium ottawaense]|uniref:hypothetical protein n=1 Tax=Bradyrhizobium ottawaense TaxID=931866 RepID=UPI0011774650|nr:hypothetical protein [Bradyrhizobium ottawaense]